MNILLLNWRDPKNPKAGGAEIVTLEHAKAWVKAGYHVIWLASSFKNAPKDETFHGIDIVRRGNSISIFLWAFMFYFFSGISFDLVIDEAHGIPFFTPFFVKKPKIFFIHEVANEIWDYMYPFPINVIGKFLETFYLPFYSNIPLWTDASSTINELQKYGFKMKNSIAIPCPMVKTIKNKSIQKEKNKTFIFVSRVVRMKGVEEVIKAFGLIHKEDLNAKLWIVGAGETSYVKKLQKMTKEYGIEKHVLFFSSVSEDEKFSLLGRGHILLHASVKEGWGLVVIEAASQGTPSVVYNVSGLRDSVKNNITGIVVSTNSPYEMAREALLLLDDKKKYQKLQSNGISWAKSLTWKDATKRSIQLIKDTTHHE